MRSRVCEGNEQAIRRIWGLFDTAGNGTINIAEFREVMTKKGRSHLRDEDIDDMLRYAGILDENEPVTFDQFMKIMMAI